MACDNVSGSRWLTLNGHILTDNGADLCIDIRMAACEPARDLDAFLKQQEKTKSPEYGCAGTHTRQINQSTLPIVIQRGGVLGAQAVFFSWWTFRIFFIFSARGRGRGVRGAKKGWGVRFPIENPRRGGFSQERGAEGLRGWEAVCGEFGGG